MQITLSIILIIACVLLIAVVLMQDSPKGQSGALTGGSDTDTHYDKIKGRTGAAILKRLTVVCGIIIVILTFAINMI